MGKLRTGSRQFIQRIFDCLDVGIFIADAQRKILAMNRHFEKVTLLPRDELVGKNVSYLLENEYISASVCEKVVRENKVVHLIIDYKTQNDVVVTGIPVYDDEGQLELIICTLKDWTSLTELKEALQQAIVESNESKRELEALKIQMENSDIVARDERTKLLFQKAIRIAAVDSTVLVLGESGVGKDVLAKFIHRNSPRCKEEFIHVNCGAIPDNLFESELFGYVSGAFTGANKHGKPGLIELADKGTLFLDEIGELPLYMQAKLLMVLQEREVMRVGDIRPRSVDVRIIAATNKDLVALVAEKKFRKDLFYRLNVVQMDVPPLRERKYDIPVLVERFKQRFNQKYQTQKSINLDVIQTFMQYDWPGNVRELEHTVESALVMANDTVKIEHLPKEFTGCSLLVHEALRLTDHYGLKSIIENIEKAVIYDIVTKSPNLQEAADRLGVDLSTLTRKKKKYGIFKKDM